MQSHANRGKPFEELINYVNNTYRAQGRAAIHKVPTEFIPLRRGGKIVSAKVENKAGVDYMGAAAGRALAFDAKSTQGVRIRWDAVEPHQAEFLDDHVRCGGIAFILVGFMAMGNLVPAMYVFPWGSWRDKTKHWKAGGPASIPMPEMNQRWSVQGHDYMRTVDDLWPPELKHGRSPR
jgi:recombination protein U